MILYSCWDKGFLSFLEGISPKVNVTARLKHLNDTFMYLKFLKKYSYQHTVHCCGQFDLISGKKSLQDYGSTYTAGLKSKLLLCPVGWGYRIHWSYLCKGEIPTTNECPRYDTKKSDGEVSVMLELWRMQSNLLLQLFPGPLWPGVVAPDRVLSTGQIE